MPGNALIRRLVRIGVLDETRMRLDYVLALKIEDFLERRLQTQVCQLCVITVKRAAQFIVAGFQIRLGQINSSRTGID